MGKDAERYKKMEIDGGPIEEYGVSCDIANVHVLLNRSFPYLWG